MTSTLDLSLFRWIGSATTEQDREALLSMKEALCSLAGSYNYLEVGSYLGGSLQPHVIDPRCENIYSIDPRPLEQRDERWSDPYTYGGNTKGKMISLLSEIPGADVQKIKTFEASSWELSESSIPATIDFAFIDGEHTNEAAMRDYIAVRRYLKRPAILSFHDCFITPLAIVRVSKMLRTESETACLLYYPRSNIVAIVFDSKALGQSLLDFGWKKELPVTYRHALRLLLARRAPALLAAIRWCKRKFESRHVAPAEHG